MKPSGFFSKAEKTAFLCFSWLDAKGNMQVAIVLEDRKKTIQLRAIKLWNKAPSS